MQCPNCKGQKQVKVIDKQWSICANCKGEMSERAGRCVHCGHPNFDDNGTVSRHNYHLETCSLCSGSGEVSKDVGTKVVAESNRGCLAGSAALGALIPGAVAGLVIGWQSAKGLSALLNAGIGLLAGGIIAMILPLAFEKLPDPRTANNLNKVYMIVLWGGLILACVKTCS